MGLKEIYLKNYKKLLIIPIVMFILSFIIIINTFHETGDIVHKDITLKGGVSATVYTKEPKEDIENFLASRLEGEFFVRRLTEFGSNEQIGIIVEATDIDAATITKLLEEKLNIELTEENFSIEETGPTLGESFYKQILNSIIFAFIFMAIVVFITFRNIIPSIAVILTAFFDILVTIAVIDFLGISVSAASIASILLLIGYSIDTDILLTTRALKRKDLEVNERLFSSVKTGLTMTGTTIAALVVGYFISNSIVIQKIFFIIIIGLIADLISTWIMNLGILKIYLDKKHG